MGGVIEGEGREAIALRGLATFQEGGGGTEKESVCLLLSGDGGRWRMVSFCRRLVAICELGGTTAFLWGGERWWKEGMVSEGRGLEEVNEGLGSLRRHTEGRIKVLGFECTALALCRIPSSSSMSRAFQTVGLQVWQNLGS